MSRQILQNKQLLELHRFSDDFSIAIICGQICVRRCGAEEPGGDCEVYVVNLPPNILMKELFTFMASCGNIYEIRLFLEFSGFSRGKCFVRYHTKSSAKKAVLVLSNTDIRPGEKVLVRMSFNNSKLMLLGIPNGVNMQMLLCEIKARMGCGLISVELSVADKEKGTQCALLSYEKHCQALEVLKKFKRGVFLWNTVVEMEWAEYKQLDYAIDTVMYFNNFPKEMTRLDLFNFINATIDVETALRMDIKNGTGYITFNSEQDRAKAYLLLSRCTIQGKKLDLRCKFRAPSTNSGQMIQPPDQVVAEQQPVNSNKIKLQSSGCVPSFCVAAQYTAPIIYHELQAVIQSVFTFLQQQFPTKSWKLFDPAKEKVTQDGQVIKLYVPVNDVKYHFLLATQK